MEIRLQINKFKMKKKYYHYMLENKSKQKKYLFFI